MLLVLVLPSMLLALLVSPGIQATNMTTTTTTSTTPPRGVFRSGDRIEWSVDLVDQYRTGVFCSRVEAYLTDSSPWRGDALASRSSPRSSQSPPSPSLYPSPSPSPPWNQRRPSARSSLLLASTSLQHPDRATVNTDDMDQQNADSETEPEPGTNTEPDWQIELGSRYKVKFVVPQSELALQGLKDALGFYRLAVVCVEPFAIAKQEAPHVQWHSKDRSWLAISRPFRLDFIGGRGGGGGDAGGDTDGRNPGGRRAGGRSHSADHTGRRGNDQGRGKRRPRNTDIQEILVASVMDISPLSFHVDNNMDLVCPITHTAPDSLPISDEHGHLMDLKSFDRYLTHRHEHHPPRIRGGLRCLHAHTIHDICLDEQSLARTLRYTEPAQERVRKEFGRGGSGNGSGVGWKVAEREAARYNVETDLVVPPKPFYRSSHRIPLETLFSAEEDFLQQQRNIYRYLHQQVEERVRRGILRRVQQVRVSQNGNRRAIPPSRRKAWLGAGVRVALHGLWTVFLPNVLRFALRNFRLVQHYHQFTAPVRLAMSKLICQPGWVHRMEDQHELGIWLAARSVSVMFVLRLNKILLRLASDLQNAAKDPTLFVLTSTIRNPQPLVIAFRPSRLNSDVSVFRAVTSLWALEQKSPLGFPIPRDSVSLSEPYEEDEDE